jgi:RNA polymerase sigma factor (sigma-70 family)
MENRSPGPPGTEQNEDAKAAPPPQRPGDRPDAERLVQEFNRSLIQMLHARLGSYEDARDVAQEAYVRLLNLDSGQAVSYHRAFLFRIAQNLATDLLRRRRLIEAQPPEGLELWPDPTTDPERSARARIAAERLPALLAQLPAKTREAFSLVRLQHMDFDEAAARLGITARMVRIHVARALVHCQQQLDDTMDEGGRR